MAFVSLGAFLEREEMSERRHELVGGRVYAQAGGSERHDLMAGLTYELLAPGARSAGCRPFMANRLLRTPSGNAYYPDIIVEVLCPSTEEVDRREKAVADAESASLRQLLLVDPDVRRIELAAPGEGAIRLWEAFGAGDLVRTAYFDIDRDALYEAVDRTATTI